MLCDTQSKDEDTCIKVFSSQGGHIPGAINFEWSSSVNKDIAFKNREELFQIFCGYGFSPEKEIITEYYLLFILTGDELLSPYHVFFIILVFIIAIILIIIQLKSTWESGCK